MKVTLCDFPVRIIRGLETSAFFPANSYSWNSESAHEKSEAATLGPPHWGHHAGEATSKCPEPLYVRVRPSFLGVPAGAPGV